MTTMLPSRHPDTLRVKRQCPRPDCGRALVRSLRYGPTPFPVTVYCCIDGCGYETEPLACCNRSADAGPPKGSTDPRWSQCLHCSKPVYRPMSQRRQGRGRFCSRKCFYAFRTILAPAVTADDWQVAV